MLLWVEGTDVLVDINSEFLLPVLYRSMSKQDYCQLHSVKAITTMTSAWFEGYCWWSANVCKGERLLALCCHHPLSSSICFSFPCVRMGIFILFYFIYFFDNGCCVVIRAVAVWAAGLMPVGHLESQSELYFEACNLIVMWWTVFF